MTDAATTPPKPSGDHVEQVERSDIAIGVIIGRTSEFFDFFVFAIAAVLVFPRFVFSFAAPVDGVL